jgi:hypothetical protein
MYKILTVLMLVLGILTACSDDTVLTRGGEATVIKGTYVAKDTDSYDKLRDVVRENNTQGIMSMIASGEANTVESGDTVTVVDPVAGYHLVEIEDVNGDDWIIQEDDLKQ